MLLTGLVQVAGVGSIVPVMGLLANPDLALDNAQLNWFYVAGGFTAKESFVLFFGVVAIIVLVISNGFVVLAVWLITRFSWSVQARLSGALLEQYVYQPYSTLLERNSASASRNILVEVIQLTSGVLQPILRIGAFGVVVLFITVFLIWFNALLAVIAVAILASGYFLIFVVVSRLLANLGKVRMDANTRRFKIVNEAVGAIKVAKVHGVEDSFVSGLKGPAHRFARSVADQQVISQTPRYIVEALAFGAVLGITLYLIQNGADLQDLVAIVGVYVFAGYRSLPAIQQVYVAWSQIRFNQIVVETLYEELRGDFERHTASTAHSDRGWAPIVRFNRVLRLDGITFTYPGADVPTIRDVSITIPYGSRVALVGETGAGKSTLMDIALGLLTPQRGCLVVDDRVIQDDLELRGWQRNVGYVPQDIYLMDDSISANIAFGVPSDRVDNVALEQAARIANIHDFINHLSHGYATVIGERGVRLSGGQRQQIGIARALYRNPQVLVLDEGTSDLDRATESAVHEAMLQLGTKTVILITHRLTTTEGFDKIYFMDQGRVVAEGRYGELLASNRRFRQMAGMDKGSQTRS